MVCRENGVFYQVGLTSWGSKECFGHGLPSVYTRVNVYVPWIKSVQQEYEGLLEAGTAHTIPARTTA